VHDEPSGRSPGWGHVHDPRGPPVNLFPPRREIRIVLLYIAGFVVVLTIMLFVAIRVA